jgi:4-hydroxythreonine-4-phosphate dehydrogenase
MSRNTEKPLIGITIGDINGIGPEVIIKALNDSRILRMMTPVVYGSTKVLSYYRKAFELEDFNYFQLRADGEPHPRKVNVVNCWEETVNITMGEATEDGGKYAMISLKAAIADLKAGKIDAMVTAPINKDNMKKAGFTHNGHTEYLTEEFGAEDSLMLLVSEKLRVGTVTGHIPLREVAKQISAGKLRSKLDILEKSLKKDFGIGKPRIAVLGLNPHAGENGQLGKEEEEIIRPVIKEFKDKGKLIFGPYPADGFFGSKQFRSFDGILAMYHDQGLIPFKTLAFESGVNFTAGLKYIRTSPDHGTAFDITGKGIADENSMREALFLAAEIAQNHRE